MMNKKHEQIARKQQHKNELTAARLRRREVQILEIEPPTRLERVRILIVCEGVNTEPSYFGQFRLTSAEIIPLGTGYNTIQVVERAQAEQEKNSFDQIWVVFDKDGFSAQHFNDAIFMAERLGFGVAYSNQAFEYWLILHFEDHQGGGMSRADYDGKLNNYLRPFRLHYDGKGSKIITKGIFEMLLANDGNLGIPRVQVAIRRARRIYDQLSHRSPADEESSTTVFKLVEEILKFL